tara:strand:+ start:358 stop:747 length:390 start_codon:yes stop_codon:yes gene_type:complete
MKVTSRIGFRMKDGSILSIYHNDGNYKWLINILETHYVEEEKIGQLITNGDIESWENEVPKHYESRPPIYDTNIISFLNNHAEEFSYVYDDGVWTCFDTRPSSKNYRGKFIKPTSIKQRVKNLLTLYKI